MALVGPAPDHVVIDIAFEAAVGPRPEVVLLGAAEPRLVAELERGAEIVLEADRADVRAVLAEIAVDESVVRVARQLERRTIACQPGAWPAVLAGIERGVVVGHAGVGQRVRLHVVVGQRQPRIAAQAEGNRRREAPALLVRRVAPGHAGIVVHGVHAHRGAIAELPVGVGGAALVAGVAHAEVAFGEAVKLGRLADDVDAAAGRAAPIIGARRALGDLDRFDIEHFARLRADIAEAIEKGAGLGIVAADKGAVANRVATLARAKGDAGNGAQYLAEAGRRRALDELVRDHGDGLGHIEQRAGRLDRRRAVCLELAVARAADGDLRQFHRSHLGVPAWLGGYGRGRDGHANGACETRDGALLLVGPGDEGALHDSPTAAV
ncbi:hypothetical protein CS8_076820 [Cupriavidus sp. 8B]